MIFANPLIILLMSPLTRGEWIEIHSVAGSSSVRTTSPLTRGEWIEISANRIADDNLRLPSPEGSG